MLFALIGGIAACIVVIIIVVLLLTQARRHQKPDDADVGAPDATSLSAGENTGRRLAVIKSDNCGHCRALMPLLEAMIAEGTSIDLVRGEDKAMSWYRENNVRGYPTICIMDGDSVVEMHRGPRTKEAILEFREEHLPAPQQS